ncbi:MAG: GNAT family N-acetyltransferase [Bacillota bacterium]
MLKGRLTSLRPLEKSDLPRFIDGMNAEEVMWHLGPHLPISDREAEAWLERVSTSEDSKIFAICDGDGKMVGKIALDRIHHRNRSAELVIAIFDEPAWNRGYGTDALRTLLRFLFEQMSFHRVQLLVHEDNERAIHVYEKLGFVREGRLRDENFRGGRYTASLVMAVLADEFRPDD